MTTVYLVCLALGGTIVLVSALGGVLGADHEVDHDADHDADHAWGGDHGWIPFLSLRFWTYGLAAFGLTGLLLGALAGTGPAAAAALAALTGLVTGCAISYATHLLKRSETQSLIDHRDIVLGRVLVAVHGERPGKIRCELNGEIIDLIAVGRDPEPLPAGTEVVVLEHQGERALVADRDRVLAAVESDIARRRDPA